MPAVTDQRGSANERTSCPAASVCETETERKEKEDLDVTVEVDFRSVF